jgi:hypothetical protein
MGTEHRHPNIVPARVFKLVGLQGEVSNSILLYKPIYHLEASPRDRFVNKEGATADC